MSEISNIQIEELNLGLKDKIAREAIDNTNKEIKSTYYGIYLSHSPYNVGDSGNIDDVLQQAIDDVYSAGGGSVYIPKGNFTKNKTTYLKNNVSLISTDETFIKKENGFYDYMFDTHVEQGLKNIKVSGGVFNGNALNFEVGNSKKGVFRFLYVDGIDVGNLKIEETAGWATTHLGCNNFKFHDIHIDQIEDTVDNPQVNGDGISGSSSNGLIENITGYANDDLVALSSGNLQSQGFFDCENVTIRNIRGEKKGNNYCHRTFALYSSQGGTINNILVEDVKGYTKYDIYIADHYDTEGGGYVGNITIRNINLKRQKTYITDSITIANLNVENLVLDNIKVDVPVGMDFLRVFNSTIKNITINNIAITQVDNGKSFHIDNSVVDSLTLTNINITIPSGNGLGVQVGVNANIKKMVLNNFALNYTGANNASYMVYQQGRVRFLQMNAVSIMSNTINNVIYYNNVSDDTSVLTEVAISNVTESGRAMINKDGAGHVSLKSFEVVVDNFNQLAPLNGDYVRKIGSESGMYFYLNDGWVKIG